MLILGIDTSGKTASVCLADEKTVFAQTTVLTRLTHSQVILPMVEKLLEDTQTQLVDVDCIAVATGPGSYTGLRIGISAVKAICFAQSKLSIGISTLESLAYNCICADAIILPMMKARPDIAYFGIFQSENGKITRLKDDDISNIFEIKELLPDDKKIILTGDYAEECFEKIFLNCENVSLAPPALRLQLASSLCACALVRQEEFSSPDKLEASYLQITKAEKDLEKA